MTILDAFDIYTRNLHLRTMRRYLGWRVLNAANQNTRAPAFPLLRAEPRAAGADVSAPRICQIDTHSPSHNAGAA